MATKKTKVKKPAASRTTAPKRKKPAAKRTATKATKAKAAKAQPAVETFFTRAEHAILSAWFEVPCPRFAKGASVWEYAGFTEYLEADEIAERKASNASLDDAELANAVARILLQDIQERLPQWSLYYADGREVHGRKTWTGTRTKDAVKPKHLFGINWATSGPGFSWPESYDLVFVPHYDRYVVTASWDSPETPEAAFGFGCTEIALGWFDQTQAVMEAVKQLVLERWEEDKDLRGGEGPRFEEVLSTGLIDVATAHAWADEVWGAADEDDDDDDAE